MKLRGVTAGRAGRKIDIFLMFFATFFMVGTSIPYYTWWLREKA
jgi:hypothetical protein